MVPTLEKIADRVFVQMLVTAQFIFDGLPDLLPVVAARRDLGITDRLLPDCFSQEVENLLLFFAIQSFPLIFDQNDRSKAK